MRITLDLNRLCKGRKAEPIGSISKDGKRKKVKNGKWIDIVESKEVAKKVEPAKDKSKSDILQQAKVLGENAYKKRK